MGVGVGEDEDAGSDYGGRGREHGWFGGLEGRCLGDLGCLGRFTRTR